MNFSWPHRAAGKAERRGGARVWIVGASAVAVAGAAALAAPGAFASSATAHVTAKHATTTTMSSVSGNVGSEIKLTAKVKGGSTPTGWVKFVYDGKALCSAGLSKGSAGCRHAFSTVGSFRVEALYEGNSTHKTSSTKATVKVLALHTTTTVTASADPGTGAPVTLTATVKSSSSATGTVTFSDAGGTLGVPVKLSGGKASLAYTWAASGAYKVTAAYSGNATHLKSSGSTTVTVAQTAYGTTTTITDPFPVQNPEGVNPVSHFTVTNNTAGGPVPTGTVTVTTEGVYNPGLPADTVYSCTDTLTAADDGAGSCTLDNGGNYGFIEVEATFVANSDEFGTSTSTGEHKYINYMPTTTTVANATGTAGETVTVVATLSANVLDPAGPVPAYGPADNDTVSFTVTDGTGAVVATCPDVALVVTAEGVPSYADCTVPDTLAAGTYTVTATFAGDEYAAGANNDAAQATAVSGTLMIDTAA